MGSKECDLRRNLGVPKDSQFVRNKYNLIVGIQTTDGSFDYTREGQKFLTKDVLSKAYPPGTISPESR